MAGDGERQMLFDIRGRRKNVVRVVYAVLALLMGGSLFLTVGPFSLGELFNTGGTSEASEVFEEQVERIEGRLAKNPKDEALLLALTRAQISAGNSKLEPSTESEAPQPVSAEARDDYDQALVSWNRYLKQAGDEPNPTAAQLVATTFFSVAEAGATSLFDIESNVETAATAQRIAAGEVPSVGSLSTLAIYEYFDGNFAAGDKAAKQAAALVPKAEAKNVEKQLAEYRKRAKRFDKQSAKFAKAQRAASGGGQALQSPSLGGLGPGALGQ
ncbi:MAG TPA: hypothetical protein VNP96_10200 [Solirubrobacterales bacterium]|nr:hypothetical protein [Solirubrobacterales bacterium]